MTPYLFSLHISPTYSLFLRLCLSFLHGSPGLDDQSISGLLCIDVSLRLSSAVYIVSFHFLSLCCDHIGLLWIRLLAQCHWPGTKDFGVFVVSLPV
jgi:hypothetical protein